MINQHFRHFHQKAAEIRCTVYSAHLHIVHIYPSRYILSSKIGIRIEFPQFKSILAQQIERMIVVPISESIVYSFVCINVIMIPFVRISSTIGYLSIITIVLSFQRRNIMLIAYVCLDSNKHKICK